MNLFEIIISMVGGGVLITFGTMLYRTGRRDEKVDARLVAIEKHFGEHGMVAMLWKFYEDGTLHSLKHERGALKENSPLSFTAALEYSASVRGGIPRSLYNRLLDMVPRAPRDNPGIVAFVIQELGWDELIKDGADKLGWPRAEYAFQWKIAIEEAQRDGLDVVAAKIEPFVVEGI